MPDLVGPIKTLSDLQRSTTLAALIVFANSQNTVAIHKGFLTNTKIKVVPLAAQDAVLNAVKHECPEIVILECPNLNPEVQLIVQKMRTLWACPILVFVDTATDEDVRTAVMYGINAFCVNGLDPCRIKSLVELAFARYAYSTALQQDLVKYKRELNGRKVIERAKGLIMERRKINESDAYDLIRRMSMAKGKPMHEVAKTILELSDLLS